MSSNAAYNQCHLIKYMKYTEFLKDKEDRILEAWVKSDAKRVKEYKEMQESLPPESCKRPHKESFRIEPTRLNLSVCLSKDYPKVEQTQELAVALEYVARMHRSDTELCEIYRSSTPPPS